MPCLPFSKPPPPAPRSNILDEVPPCMRSKKPEARISPKLRNIVIVETPPATPRGRGRPVGSKNKK